ncbi:MAG: glycosyltransferase family 2 protein [Verrucomicrobiales bacterium]|nr:glycosyltransferase family 2 protein [Verrucomicrobiales bacterium]
MPAASSITPLILTFNEEPNLRRCLERLTWASQVVIVDSGSTDGTASIAAEFSNTRLLVRPFDDHTAQWNFGVEAVSTPWVLALDADYLLGEGFSEELAELNLPDNVDACFAGFRYVIAGKPLRASLYPPRAVLFRKDRCRYVQDGHTQMLLTPGATQTLCRLIDHDDRKPLSRWFASQDKYAQLEATKLAAANVQDLRMQDKLRRTMFAAIPATLIYTLLVKRTLFDGWRGWFYTLQRTIAEVMLALHLIKQHLERDR